MTDTVKAQIIETNNRLAQYLARGAFDDDEGKKRDTVQQAIYNSRGLLDELDSKSSELNNLSREIERLKIDKMALEVRCDGLSYANRVFGDIIIKAAELLARLVSDPSEMTNNEREISQEIQKEASDIRDLRESS